MCTAANDQAGSMRILSDKGLLALIQGEYEQARVILTEALEIDQAQALSPASGYVRCYLGFATLLVGETEAAGDHLRDGVRLQRLREDNLGLMYLAIGLSGVANRYCNYVRAATLVGAANRLQSDAGTQLVPASKDAFDREIGIMQEALGPQRFLQAWAAGVAMTLDETIEFALEPDTPLDNETD